MAGQERGRGHTRWLSDATIWCSRCGQYATQAAVGLTRTCQPMRKGTASNRNALLRGVHPWTGVPFVAPPVPEFGWQSLPVAAIAAKPASLGEVSRQRRGCSAAAKLHEVAEKLSHRPGASARGGSGTSREAPATALQGGAFQTHVLAVFTSPPQIVHVSNSFVCACVPGLTHVRLQRPWCHPSSQGRPICSLAPAEPCVLLFKFGCVT